MATKTKTASTAKKAASKKKTVSTSSVKSKTKSADLQLPETDRTRPVQFGKNETKRSSSV
ncbi:hypothetical protein [Leptospira ellisii]|uniref:hypothetical protein n=1 Tax=Leptospira ellisii TaxID=2023197 RepID=UPI000C2B0832|nr:hypothetical protein [Leptospira ellisii]PKA03830.1 hypothetical protein CH375_14665 [Leptospira ellisii]